MTDRPIVLITGASRGLGRAMAGHLVRADFDVIGTYHDRRDRADELVAELADDAGQIHFLHLDLTDPEAVPAFVPVVSRTLHDQFDDRRLWALINNAGVARFVPFVQTTPEDFDLMMRVNLRAPYFLTQHLLPLLSEGASVLNLSAAITRDVVPTASAYAATKGALEVLTRYQAVELADRGVRVNTLMGGAATTELGDGAMLTDAVREQAAHAVAFGRIGEPDEMTVAVTALLSDAFPWTTGSIVDVSGGQGI